VEHFTSLWLVQVMEKHISFFEGVAVGGLLMWLYCRYSHHKRSSTLSLGDDDCQSLFYGKQISAEGEGFPHERTGYGGEELANMMSVRPQYVRLPKSLYRDVVWNLPTVCVDVVLQRKSDNKVLLFFRRDKPAANIWLVYV
jgi:hypothetical protein